MKTRTWAVFGSLFINLALGLLIAVIFSAAPPARAGEPARSHCAHDAHAKPSPTRTVPVVPAAPVRRAYLVDVRMGWAPGG
jgi:hypothetical protein